MMKKAKIRRFRAGAERMQSVVVVGGEIGYQFELEAEEQRAPEMSDAGACVFDLLTIFRPLPA